MLRLFYFYLLSAAIGSVSMAFSQPAERYVRAGILLEDKPLSELARLGLDIDHGIYLPGRLLVADLLSSELEQVRKAGFTVKVWIADLQRDYEERLYAAEPRGDFCPNKPTPNYPTPANYTYGSMGGYHTLDEMMAVLDDMRKRFPHLISARIPLTPAPAHTWEGRRIWYVRLSDNPDTDEDEPEVLYTALHHAREPNSASQMLYFMWYLLENYEHDPQVRYIVDHAELYFVPCLNPDGYVYNQTTNPQGGGLWRKNRRPNDNNTFGVDLNRNYGYFWGANDVGSSPNPSAQTYRGPEAFSEPETRALRDFMQAHRFVFVLNHHTHGNLLIYPWGYNNAIADPAFPLYAALLTRQNAYKTGTAGQTVGYAVNGVSDDWMFAALDAYALTPEVGPSFWPLPQQIEALNRENVWMNLATALCALHYGEARDVGPLFLTQNISSLTVEFVRYGQQDGPFTVSLTPLTPDVQAVYPSQQLISPALFDKQFLSFEVHLKDNIAPGSKLSFLLRVDNGAYTQTTVVDKFYGGGAVRVFDDQAIGTNQWAGTWAVTQEAYCSAPGAFTDSPNSSYAPGANSIFISSWISLPAQALSPRLRFCARWEIEPYFDYVQVRALDGAESIPLCGRYTKPGTGKQPYGEPVYDGLQRDWVEEYMDLEALAGRNFRIAFLLRSDSTVQFDGFYVDDIVVEYDDLSVSVAPEPLPINLWSQPNPADAYAQVWWGRSEALADDRAQLMVYDALGQLVGVWTVCPRAGEYVELPTFLWPSGTYIYRMQTAQGASAPGRLIVLHR